MQAVKNTSPLASCILIFYGLSDFIFPFPYGLRRIWNAQGGETPL